MKNKILAVILSAVVLFAWGAVSWTVLPWYTMVANQFNDEAAVSKVLKENASAAGVYFLPFSEEDHKPGEAAAFVNVLPNGMDMNMGKMMGIGMLGQIVSTFLVFLLLSQTTGLSYWQRVGFVALVGVSIGFISHFPYWNWFGFSTSYVLVTIADYGIGWTLAGLVMGRFCLGKSSTT